MSFDKKYPNRKDWRKPFRAGKAVNYGCRNHGSCPYCRDNRQVNKKRIELAIKDELNTVGFYDGEVCLNCGREECRCIEEFEEMELPAIEWMKSHQENNINQLYYGIQL